MAVDIFLIDWERPKPGQETNKVGSTSVTGRVTSEGIYYFQFGPIIKKFKYSSFENMDVFVTLG